MRSTAIFSFVLFVCLTASAQIKQYKNCTTEEVAMFWENTLSVNKKYTKFIKNNSQQVRSLRRDFNDKSKSVISQIEQNEGFYTEDIFLKDYLTNLVQLLSGGINKTTGTIATANIMLDVNANACAYPNGALVFNTRLLAMMDCEEELLGVVAHEIAHYKLEHALSNYIEMEKKAQRSKNWAALASIATVALGTAADITDIANGGVGVGGVATGVNMGLAIEESIYQNLVNMGYKFSQQQELEADKVAVELLEHIGIPGSYYASALDKLRQEDYRFGREIVKTKKKSTHPSLDERISKIGEVANVEADAAYTKKIAGILTIDAFVEKNVRKDYKRAMDVFKRISNATSLSLDDYLIMIPTMLEMNNTETSNNQVLLIVQDALTRIEQPEIQSLRKQEAILHVRLNNNEQAKTSLHNYIRYCESRLGESVEEEQRAYFVKEKSWAESSLSKL